MRDEDARMKVTRLERTSDGKLLTLQQLVGAYRAGKVTDENTIYQYRHSEESDEEKAWITLQELQMQVQLSDEIKKKQQEVTWKK